MPDWQADDIAIETYNDILPRLRQLEDYKKSLEQFILGRIANREGATEAAGQHHRAVRVPGGVDWSYDLERLADLQKLVPPEQYDECIEPIPATFKVNKTKLNALARRGGEIKAIIDSACHDVPKPPKLEIRPL